MTLNPRDTLPQSADNIDRDLFPKEEIRPRIYIFFSFDLVGSTEYKNTQKKEWPKVFALFYESIIKEMKDQCPKISVWKYVGDEVLFYKILDTRADLFNSIPNSFEALTSSLKHLKNRFKKTLKPLSIKGTIWCAPVVIGRGEELENLPVKEAPNIALKVVYGKNNSLLDFIGPDIDTGFRISRYAEKGKLVISADFAYLLLESEAPTNVNKDTMLQNLRIVSYEELKGIWKGRYYPVIWYFKAWEKNKEDFADFDYDDRFRSKIINNIFQGQSQDIKVLTKIFRQLRLLKSNKNLLTILKESEKIFENKRIDNQQIPVKSI
ncbi:MAG TPA: hypothetical protein VK469_21600 [Candidatus Kapabacteria bacterium]|nr:hypothetical protein [Candidatus Kapabacteria bacterium]